MAAIGAMGGMAGSVPWVHPTNFQSLVKAQNASHTISAYTDESGNFVLHGVPAGTYQVTVTPEAAAGLEVINKDNIEVEEDADVDIETIYLE